MWEDEEVFIPTDSYLMTDVHEKRKPGELEASSLESSSRTVSSSAVMLRCRSRIQLQRCLGRGISG
jgi:hypothetical protein